LADNNRQYKLTDIGSLIEKRAKKKIEGIGKSLSDIKESLPRELLFKKIIVFLAKKCSVLLIAYLFGGASIVFDTYPFGIALLCGADDNILLLYIGLLLSALERRSEATALFLVYTACIVMRFAFSRWISPPKEKPQKNEKGALLPDKLFCEPFSLRFITVLICSLSQGLARLISDGFLYYDLFGLFACVLAAPALFSAFYCLTHVRKRTGHLVFLSACVFVFSIVYSIRLYYILGFSAGVIAAYLITLYVAKKFGVMQGCVFGLFAGLACGLSMGPAFALIGFVFGTLVTYSLFAGVSAALLTGLFFGVASNGFPAFSTLLPELALASSIFLPLSYYNLLPKAEIFTPERITISKKLEEAIINDEKIKDSAIRLESVSESLDSLSRTIAALSDKLKRPDVLDLKRLCEDSFQNHCQRCSLAGVCYGKDCAGTFDLMGKFTSALSTKGRIDMTDVPEHVASKCFNILKIVSEANISYSKHLEKLIRSDKTSVFAIDYKAMSKLILDASKINDEEYEPNPELASKIVHALKYMDIDADGVFAYGKRNLKISLTGMNLSQIKYSAPQIRTALENICNARLTLPTFELDEDRLSMSVRSERIYKVSFAHASTKMESSDYNGDTHKAFENKNDCFYYLISDGMGSGRDAAMTSRLCSMFLSKLLSAGCAKNIVIEMLNGFIRNKSEECSASIDLVELDLLSSKGCFVKSGAAPSYILRDKNLYKLQSKTLPIGILKETDAELIDFDIHDNDIIIMFSDGVAASLEDGIWLTGMLCFEFDDDINKMADKILERALECNSKADDMTVAIIKIEKEKRE